MSKARWMSIAACACLFAGPTRVQAALVATSARSVTTAVASSGTAAPRERKRSREQTKSQPKKGQTGSSAASFQRARRAIRSGDYELARALVRRMSKTAKRAERNAWRIVEAELAIAQERYARAGLVAMRIVILQPKSRQVGVAFYWTARAYEGLGRPRKAIALYESSLAHKTTRRSTREKAEKRLAKLKAKAAVP